MMLHECPASINPLMANDTFKRHKRFHLLEKAQFSQEKVQTCENHQVRRADFGEKNPHFFSVPPALKCAGFEGVMNHITVTKHTMYTPCICVGVALGGS